MVALLTNVFITLILVCIVAAYIYNSWPKLSKLLEEKLKISLFREASDKSSQPLKLVFYKFNHNGGDDWINWMMQQDEMTKERAFAKLLDHLEGDPKKWGAATPEAVKAVSKFEFEENFDVLVDFLDSCKTMWGRYKAITPCYEEACKGVIQVNPANAKDIIFNEIKFNGPRTTKEQITKSVALALPDFPEDFNIDDIFLYILTNQKLSSKIRDQVIRITEDRNGENVRELFIEALKAFIDPSFGEIEGDNLKIYHRLVNLATNIIDEEIFNLLVKGSTNEHSGITTIKLLAELVSNSNIEFSDHHLIEIYKLGLKDPLLINALAKRHALSTSELGVVENENAPSQYPFKKDTINSEQRKEEFTVPQGVKDSFTIINDALAKRSVINESGENVEGGGVLVGGAAEADKLFCARVLASQRKWSLIYGKYEELTGMNINNLIDEANEVKPCLLYIENVHKILLEGNDSKALKTLKQLCADPMIFIIGTIDKDIDIKEEGQKLPVFLDSLPRDVFPLVRNLETCDDQRQGKILDEYLKNISSDKYGTEFNASELLAKVTSKSAIDIISYLLSYFKFSLLTHGELISANEYERMLKNKCLA